MNKLDKIIFINKVFAISDTKRIMYGQGEELTLAEWNNADLDDLPELSDCLELAQSAQLYAEMKLTKEEADDFNAYGQLLERADAGDDSDELADEIDDFFRKKHEDSFGAYHAVSDYWYKEDYLGAKEGEPYWDRIEYFF